MLGKNGLHIRAQQEKSYQNYKHFYLGFEKVLKMQASVIDGVLVVKYCRTATSKRRSYRSWVAFEITANINQCFSKFMLGLKIKLQKIGTSNNEIHKTRLKQKKKTKKY